MDLGTKIKRLRKAKGITQKQLAEQLHMSKRSIEKYENNEITNININILQDIASALDVSLLSLLVEDPSDILFVIKQYYNLEDKPCYNLEKDFYMIMKGFIDRYKNSLYVISAYRLFLFL